jgi:hypothetical protein
MNDIIPEMHLEDTRYNKYTIYFLGHEDANYNYKNAYNFASIAILPFAIALFTSERFDCSSRYLYR